MMRNFLTLAALMGLAGLAPAGEPIALVHGKIYTGNDRGSVVQAVVCVDGRITLVGSDAIVKSHLPAKTRIIDLRGGTVFAGPDRRARAFGGHRVS